MKKTFEEFLNGRTIKSELVDVLVGKNSIEMMDGWDVDEIDLIVGSEGKTFYSAAEAVQFLENNGLLLDQIKDQGFGIVTFEGKQYALTQQPYIDGPTGVSPNYKASGVDQE